MESSLRNTDTVSHNKKIHKVMLIISLLSLNIVEQAGGAISAAIPAMARSFPSYSITEVELSTTVISVFSTIFLLLSGFVTSRIGQKRTALIGIGIATIAALIPAFANNLPVIIVSRSFMGVGIGLANPLAISLIGEFFEGDMLATLMGWRSAIGSLGSSIMTFGAGYLLQISWHSAYLVYLLFIPAFILFLIFVPSPEKYGVKHDEKAAKSVAAKQETVKHSFLAILGLAFELFLNMAVVMVAFIKLAEMYLRTGIGSATEASTALSIFGIAQLASGALFGPFFKILHDKLFYVAMFLAGAGLAAFYFATNSLYVIAMLIIVGGIGGMCIPFIFTRVSEVTSTKRAPLYNGIVLTGSSMGTFVAPFLGNLVGGNNAQMAIANSGLILMVMTLVLIAIKVFNTLSHRNAGIEQG